MTKSSNKSYLNHFAVVSKSILICFWLISSSLANAQDISQPPELGQETKGTPAVIESTAEATENDAVADDAETEANEGTEITELRRENGLVYQIELNHSSGSKQYITETDSDGNIESTDNDIEVTPNLPKWKVGSW